MADGCYLLLEVVADVAAVVWGLRSAGLVAHGCRVGDSRAISKRLMSLSSRAAEFVFRFLSFSYVEILEWSLLLSGMPNKLRASPCRGKRS